MLQLQSGTWPTYGVPLKSLVIISLQVRYEYMSLYIWSNMQRNLGQENGNVYVSLKNTGTCLAIT